MKLLTILIMITLVGCAGIINGTSQSVTINSTPEDAEVYIDGELRGTTPLTVKLKKNRYDTIMVKKKGYKTLTKPLSKAYDGTAILNIFWDSSTTDFITGAAYEYEPNSYHFKLARTKRRK